MPTVSLYLVQFNLSFRMYYFPKNVFFKGQFAMFLSCQQEIIAEGITMSCINCVKSIQIRSFFWSVFSHFRTEYRDLPPKSLYSSTRKMRSLIKNIVVLLNGSRKIAPEENCPPALILTLIVHQTLNLTGGNFPRGRFSGHPFELYSYWDSYFVQY